MKNNLLSFTKTSVYLVIVSMALGTGNINAQIPHIEYSTLLGGNSWDYGHAITVDTNGYAYLAGQANSSNFPTTVGAFDESYNGDADIFVSKLNLDGSSLIYSTVVGGSSFDDCRAVYVDKSGSIYLTGGAQSANFPQPTAHTIPGNSQSYFFKLNAEGSGFDYLSKWAGGAKIITDNEGYAILIGITSSSAFLTTKNAYDTLYGGGDDLFVAKMDLEHDSIVFSTFLGGSAEEWCYGNSVAIDNQNNIIVSGTTNSADFPTKGTTYSNYISGKNNIFITKIKSDGSDIVFSTIIGGNDDDDLFSVVVDTGNNIYITGVTTDGYPVTENAYDTSYNGNYDAFITKLSPDGSQLIYSTYIGGSDKESGRSLKVDPEGKVYTTGCTRSTDFPVSTDALFETYNGGGTDQYSWGDAYLLVLNPDGSQIEFSSYLGSSSDDEAYDIALAKNGGVYLCGITTGNNFPTTNDAYQRKLNGNGNAYVTKFIFNDISHELSVSTHELSVAAGANSKVSFGITANTSWTVTSPELWLSFDRKIGVNSDSVVVTAKTNRETIPRTGIITVSGSGVNEQTISITQDAKTTGIAELKNEDIEIIPNPSKGIFELSFGTTPLQTTRLEIINIQGKLIYSETFQNTSSAIIDLTNYISGVYLVKIISNENIFVKKIIKE